MVAAAKSTRRRFELHHPLLFTSTDLILMTHARQINYPNSASTNKWKTKQLLPKKVQQDNGNTRRSGTLTFQRDRRFFADSVITRALINSNCKYIFNILRLKNKKWREKRFMNSRRAVADGTVFQANHEQQHKSVEVAEGGRRRRANH